MNAGSDEGRRAARAHDRLVTALYGGELERLDGVCLLHNPFLEEPEWSHAGAIEVEAASWSDRLETIRGAFRRHGRRPAVVTDPWTSPASLAGRLAGEGWTEAFRHLGLVYPERAQLPPFAWPERAAVDELATTTFDASRSSASLEAFLAVFVAAFAETAPDYDFSGYRRAIPFALERPLSGVDVVHTVVSIDGEPAAVGSRVLADGVAGLYNLGVAPRFRARGLGASVTFHRVAAARAAGAELVYLLTEDPRVEAAQRRRGFEPAFELVGHVEPAPGDEGPIWQASEELRP